ncbi:MULTISPECIES: hypothetical protein [Microvirga]|uniref:hypothetical protein n=1 Tax=Microvirga TaxID=186650 RepID=UPI001686AE1C|nr:MULTISPECIES: hypothetical protein [Microvirga]MBD2750750.1 hypothetical protein [Microvirga sp.]
MSDKFNLTPTLGRGTVMMSLVAAVACAAAVDPGQIAPSTEYKSNGHDLSPHIEALAMQIRKLDPIFDQNSSPSVQLAQWRNY